MSKLASFNGKVIKYERKKLKNRLLTVQYNSAFQLQDLRKASLHDVL